MLYERHIEGGYAEIVVDRTGYVIGDDFFVKVFRRGKMIYKAWVEGWDGAMLLTVRDTRQFNTHPARPSDVEVVKPSTMDTAKRTGMGKSVAAISKASMSKKNQRVSTPRGKS